MPPQKLFSQSSDTVIVYTDGGSRGNPGEAAAGFVVGDKEYGEFLGVQTNNYAEYHAVILALKKLKSLVGKEKAKKTDVEVRSDSELLVRQMNRQYKVTDDNIKIYFVDVLNLTLDFKSVAFIHIPREKNKRADAMVNKTLDAHRG